MKLRDPYIWYHDAVDVGYTHTKAHIYIYRERERQKGKERERERNKHRQVHEKKDPIADNQELVVALLVFLWPFAFCWDSGVHDGGCGVAALCLLLLRLCYSDFMWTFVGLLRYAGKSDQATNARQPWQGP